MKEIDRTLLDSALQSRILQELERKGGIGVFARDLEATEGVPPDKQYANIRYLQLKGYLILEKIPFIGCNCCLENSIILNIAPAGRAALNIF